MRSTQPCNHRLRDQLIRRDGPSSHKARFGKANRREKNSARGDAGRVKWRKASEFSKTRSRHLWAPSIRGPRVLATYTFRRVPTSNRLNRCGRPHLGDTYIALWFASSRPHRCKPRRPTPSLHQQPADRRSPRQQMFHRYLLEFLGRAVKTSRWQFGCHQGGSEPSGTHFILGD